MGEMFNWLPHFTWINWTTQIQSNCRIDDSIDTHTHKNDNKTIKQ